MVTHRKASITDKILLAIIHKAQTTLSHYTGSHLLDILQLLWRFVGVLLDGCNERDGTMKHCALDFPEDAHQQYGPPTAPTWSANLHAFEAIVKFPGHASTITTPGHVHRSPKIIKKALLGEGRCRKSWLPTRKQQSHATALPCAVLATARGNRVVQDSLCVPIRGGNACNHRHAVAMHSGIFYVYIAIAVYRRTLAHQ